jgi:hypothetical protein
MHRMIKVFLVAALMAVILVATISPAIAAKARGGVLLPTEQPCLANTPETPQGVRLVLDPPGRAPGCWVLLPPGVASDEPVTVDPAGVVV